MSQSKLNDKQAIPEFFTGSPSENKSKKPTGKNIGLIFASIIGGSAVLISCICIPFVTPALRRIILPYVPATDAQVINVFKALQGRTGKLVDLGSGDGRIVLEAARFGFKGYGVELNPWLVIYSKFQALRQNVSTSTSFYRRNIWNTTLTPYQNVVIFGVDSMMGDLEKKCQTELKPDSVVIACRFPFPTLQPNLVLGEGIDTVWKYNI